MIRKKNFLIITLFFALLVNGQEFDLNNIKIEDVKNVLQGVFGAIVVGLESSVDG